MTWNEDILNSVAHFLSDNSLVGSGGYLDAAATAVSPSYSKKETVVATPKSAPQTIINYPSTGEYSSYPQGEGFWGNLGGGLGQGFASYGKGIGQGLGTGMEIAIPLIAIGGLAYLVMEGKK